MALLCETRPLQVGANRSFMHSTTQVADWQLALFGGLRYKDYFTPQIVNRRDFETPGLPQESDDQKKHTCMVLDNWLQAQHPGQSSRHRSLF